MLKQFLALKALFLTLLLPLYSNASMLTINSGQMLALEFSMEDSSEFPLLRPNMMAFAPLEVVDVGELQSVTYRLYDEGNLLGESTLIGTGIGNGEWVATGIRYMDSDNPFNDTESFLNRKREIVDLSSIFDGTGSGRIEYIPEFVNDSGFIQIGWSDDVIEPRRTTELLENFIRWRFNYSYYGDISLAEVQPVPLPASAWLFGSVLIGFAVVRRKSVIPVWFN